MCKYVKHTQTAFQVHCVEHEIKRLTHFFKRDACSKIRSSVYALIGLYAYHIVRVCYVYLLGITCLESKSECNVNYDMIEKYFTLPTVNNAAISYFSCIFFF